jgi:hypothetical protein
MTDGVRKQIVYALAKPAGIACNDDRIGRSGDRTERSAADRQSTPGASRNQSEAAAPAAACSTQLNQLRVREGELLDPGTHLLQVLLLLGQRR